MFSVVWLSPQSDFIEERGEVWRGSEKGGSERFGEERFGEEKFREVQRGSFKNTLKLGYSRMIPSSARRRHR